MTKSYAILGAMFALGACHGPAPVPRATSAEADIAMVERAQQSQQPIQPLRPQSVSFADFKDPASDLHVPHELGDPRAGDGCSLFVPEDPRAPVLVALPPAGLMKFDGGWELFAADSGSLTIPAGLHVAYSSGNHTMQLAPAEGGGGRRTAVTLRDKYGRMVWQGAGELRCKT